MECKSLVMSIFKKTVKRLLPARLQEILAFILQQQEHARKYAQINEKNRQKIDALLKNPLPINLELGSGKNRGIAGWTYVDVNMNCDLTLDLTQPLPFPDNSVSIIYSSHLLEHFNYPILINFLEECLRILKPGGIFNAAVPNARIYLKAYQYPEAFDSDTYCRYEPAYHYNSKIDYINYIAYMDGQHQYLFDEDNIVAILKKIPFKNVRLRKFDEHIDIQNRSFQSIYVLGEK